MKKIFCFLFLGILLSGNVSADDKGHGSVYNAEVMAYLRNLLSPSEVEQLCNRAIALVKLNQNSKDKLDACTALAYEMGKLGLQKESTEAVRLMAPPVCNDRIYNLLISKGIERKTVDYICKRARTNMACTDLPKSEALRRALRARQPMIPQITESVIRQCAALLE